MVLPGLSGDMLMPLALFFGSRRLLQAYRGSSQEGVRALEPDEHELMGSHGYDPKGCTRLERTANIKILRQQS